MYMPIYVCTQCYTWMHVCIFMLWGFARRPHFLHGRLETRSIHNKIELKQNKWGYGISPTSFNMWLFELLIQCFILSITFQILYRSLKFLTTRLCKNKTLHKYLKSYVTTQFKGLCKQHVLSWPSGAFMD